MELEELKNAWTALDNRLKENETLKESIIKEMLHSKINKSLNRLIRFEMLGAILCFIGLPFLVFRFGYMKHTLFIDTTMYLAIALIFSGWITQSYKLWLLSKIDPNKPVSNNINFFHRYNLFIKREKMALCIYAPILYILIILVFVNLGRIELWRWAAVIAILVFTLLMCYWQYKKIYDANIHSIMKSMEELKELKD